MQLIYSSRVQIILGVMNGNRRSVSVWRRVLSLSITISLLSTLIVAQNADLSRYHNATVISVRELRSTFPVARWSGVHEFTLHFSLGDSEGVHCYEFRSVVLQDVNDLRANSGHQIKMLQRGNKLNAILDTGRSIKADVTKADQCQL